MNTALNTLFVSTDGAKLQKDHETVLVTVEGERRAQIPIHHLKGIVCLCRAWVSPELMAHCAESGIAIAFFDMRGRFLARVEGLPGGNVLLRRAQFRAADDVAKTLEIARSCVLGKVANARAFLQHARRDAAEARQADLAEAIQSLGASLRAIEGVAGLDELRGMEGNAARTYFGCLSALVKREEEVFSFSERTRQPPRDPINALLSFGYALLLQECAGAAAGVGLDPAVGFLHEERPGRLSLALDLMEELRSPIVDRLVVAFINRGQVGPGDFRTELSGGVYLNDAARKAFIVAYQEAKATEVRHEFLDMQVSWGRVPHLQALLLARVIRGELDRYPPFALR